MEKKGAFRSAPLADYHSSESTRNGGTRAVAVFTACKLYRQFPGGTYTRTVRTVRT